MNNVNKYTRSFYLPPHPERYRKWAEKSYIDRAPDWCSVDLRDGNQALIIPMSLDEKLEFFDFLVEVGFKEIEIGFPAASDTEYAFARRLIEDGRIPDDVTVQVLTQSREHIIRKTFEALQGCKNAIVHLYNSTSVAQREQVFKKDKAEIVDIAVTGAKLLQKLATETAGNFRFEYSPESFTGTEPEFALEICNAVLDVWKPTPDKKAIINLPVTVQCSMPHVYATQVEYVSENLRYRDGVTLSTHPHNDRGTGIADAECAVLAGCDRIEGTLFGNGERTGNVDIVTLAMNMYAQGVDPKLDFSHIDRAVETYEKLTSMQVSPRAPYAGKLVFTAFSGSHQDAIAKGLAFRKSTKPAHWTVPYLPIDPEDVGRGYDGDVIRINSQSGKGGIGYLLEQKFGFNLPPKMREDCGYKVKGVSDRGHKELSPADVYDVFEKEYLNVDAPVRLVDYSFDKDGDRVSVQMTVNHAGLAKVISGVGNGQLNAAVNAVKAAFNLGFTTHTYSEHALESGSDSRAAAYVGISDAVTGKSGYACSIDNDIMRASISALLGAVNNLYYK